MTDDWRLRIELGDDDAAARLGQLLADQPPEHELERAYSQRVVVSIDGPTAFCYAGSQEQAQAARAVIERLASEHGWHAELTLARWHPTSERWESPEVPLPDGDVAAEREREERIADERQESRDQGYPEYEVRIRCGDRRRAHELAERLEHEGVPNVRRHNYVLVGATDEDSAQALADRLRGEAPPGAELTVELNPLAIYEEMPRSPFTLLGGLSG
jgi:hypothetical protein